MTNGSKSNKKLHTCSAFRIRTGITYKKIPCYRIQFAASVLLKKANYFEFLGSFSNSPGCEKL